MEFQQGVYQAIIPKNRDNAPSIRVGQQQVAQKIAQKNSSGNLTCLNDEQSPLTVGTRFRSVCHRPQHY